MIHFDFLSDSANEEILDCFNHAFSDYFVPLKLTLPQLESKLDSENINKNISVGACKEDKLVGFILHGERLIGTKRIAYNAGTGVLPSERGAGLTRRMYDFVLPILQSKHIAAISLEVISKNIPAIKSYEKVGFKTMRQLDCFKGDLVLKNVNNDIKIVQASDADLQLLRPMGEVKPTWQSSFETIHNLGETVVYILAYLNDEVVGYSILNSINNRILQIAVKKEFRRQNIGNSLLNYIANNISKSTSIINVDQDFEGVSKFLQNTHLERIITQIDMQLDLSANG